MKNYTNILIHYVWGTQEPSPVLVQPSMRELLYEVIRTIGNEQGFKILFVAGLNDHLHLIVELGKNQKVARIAHTVKDMTEGYFKKEFGLSLNWQESFLGLSISQKEFSYMTKNFAEHDAYHTQKSFEQEYMELITGI